ncbi:MAG: hypothetical protein ACYCZX_20205 [Rhodospirillaceae bacterium]
MQQALATVDETTPEDCFARLLTWHVGDVKDIEDPSDHVDAMRAAQLHAELRNAFGEGQALLRAGSVWTLPADDGEALLRKAHGLLAQFGPTQTLARCLSARVREVAGRRSRRGQGHAPAGACHFASARGGADRLGTAGGTTFLGERFNRFQRLIAHRNVWDKRNVRAYLMTPREDFVTKRNLDRDNTNVVVRRDSAIGDTIRDLVHRWCRPGRTPKRLTLDMLADA